MSIDKDVEKAKAAEQSALNRLNQEESWVSGHPGWVTLIAVGLVLACIVMAVKGCH